MFLAIMKIKLLLTFTYTYFCENKFHLFNKYPEGTPGSSFLLKKKGKKASRMFFTAVLGYFNAQPIVYWLIIPSSIDISYIFTHYKHIFLFTSVKTN